MTLTDIEEYNLRSIAISGCNMYGQITVAHVTLPKAVLSTVKIFSVHCVNSHDFALHPSTKARARPQPKYYNGKSLTLSLLRNCPHI